MISRILTGRRFVSGDTHISLLCLKIITILIQSVDSFVHMCVGDFYRHEAQGISMLVTQLRIGQRNIVHEAHVWVFFWQTGCHLATALSRREKQPRLLSDRLISSQSGACYVTALLGSL